MRPLPLAGNDPGVEDGSVIGHAIPALPVSDVASATRFYAERLGFAVLHEEAGFAIVQRDTCLLQLWSADDFSWRERPDLVSRPVSSGAESFLAGTASCRIEVSGNGVGELYAELQAAKVLHPTSRSGVSHTDYGTDEVHALDRDGNLLSFFAPR